VTELNTVGLSGSHRQESQAGRADVVLGPGRKVLGGRRGEGGAGARPADGKSLSPVGRLRLHRMATAIAAFDRFEFLDFPCPPGGSYVPDIGKGVA
jgi:hypothetical protein